MQLRLLVVSHACVRAVNRAAYSHLLRMGWHVDLVVPRALDQNGGSSPCDPAGPDDPPLHALPLRGRNPRTYRFSGLSRLIRAQRPDWIVIDNDPQSILGVELALLRARAGFRLAFLTCENLPFGAMSLLRRKGVRGLATSAFLAACRWIVRPRTDLILSINSAGADIFRAARFRRVVQTPLGFPERLFNVDPAARARTRERLGLSGPVLAYFGRLVPEKGPHLLIDALAGLVDHDWTLLLDQFMPADAYQRALLDRLHRSGLGSRVRFVEASHNEVADVMRAADVVVLPSISTPNWVEQYGRVAPEAMASGCLVVAADSGALADLVADSGVLVPEGDTTALRSAIKNCLDQPDSYPAMEGRGAQRARESLSARAQAERWDQELRTLSSR
jgi:glycosyltransferase involved in cell wall biosynthesis